MIRREPIESRPASYVCMTSYGKATRKAISLPEGKSSASSTAPSTYSSAGRANLFGQLIPHYQYQNAISAAEKEGQVRARERETETQRETAHTNETEAVNRTKTPKNCDTAPHGTAPTCTSCRRRAQMGVMTNPFLFGQHLAMMDLHLPDITEPPPAEKGSQKKAKKEIRRDDTRRDETSLE